MSESLSAPLEGVLERIRYRPSGKNAIEARIAAAILDDPTLVARESITSFCERTAVSAGSVVRFTKLVGFRGFHDLKLALVASSAPVERHEPAPTRFHAAMDEQIRAMLFAREEMPLAQIEWAGNVLASAQRVDVVATGASAAVAQSILFSMTLLGLHARYLPDSQEQGAAAAFAGPEDALVAVSFSGRTRSVVDAARRARDAGANVIALTCNNRAPLVRAANVPIVLDARHGRFDAEWPMRTAMFAVARCLTVAITIAMPADDLRHRRSLWSSGRFGIRYDDARPVS